MRWSNESNNYCMNLPLLFSCVIVELDSSILERISECRIRQIATGCGYPITDVMEMLEGYKKVAKHLGRMKEVRSLRMEVGYAKLLRPYRA